MSFFEMGQLSIGDEVQPEYEVQLIDHGDSIGVQAIRRYVRARSHEVVRARKVKEEMREEFCIDNLWGINTWYGHSLWWAKRKAIKVCRKDKKQRDKIERLLNQ